MKARWILFGTLTAAAVAAAAGCGSAAVSSSAARSAAINAPIAASGQAAGGSYSAALPASGGSSVGHTSSGPSNTGSGSPSTSPALSADSAAEGVVVGSPGADVARSVAASYTVPPGSFLSSFDTVIADGVALGGYVVSSDTSPNAEGRIVSGAVTLAVPSAQMGSLLNSLPSSFTASSINFSSVDDTSDIVDLNARLTSAQAHLTALQGLLAKATSLSDITTLEQQIEDVETSIDTDQDQLTTFNQAVTYATATIRLKERGAVTVAAATGPSPTSGLSKGWTNVLFITTVGLEVLVTAVPAVVLLLIGWFVWRLWRRRAPTPRAEATA